MGPIGPREGSQKPPKPPKSNRSRFCINLGAVWGGAHWAQIDAEMSAIRFYRVQRARMASKCIPNAFLG